MTNICLFVPNILCNQASSLITTGHQYWFISNLSQWAPAIRDKELWYYWVVTSWSCRLFSNPEIQWSNFLRIFFSWCLPNMVGICVIRCLFGVSQHWSSWRMRISIQYTVRHSRWCPTSAKVKSSQICKIFQLSLTISNF